jgi:hypothetical protein
MGNTQNAGRSNSVVRWDPVGAQRFEDALREARGRASSAGADTGDAVRLGDPRQSVTIATNR